MYTQGQLVVYGGEGVCRVEEVIPCPLRGGDPNRLYYTLLPLYRTGQVLTPVDTKVLLRPLMSRSEAETLVREFNRLPALPPLPVNPRLMKDYCQRLLNGYDCASTAALLIFLANRSREALLHGKKPSALDERFMKRSEEQLYGELAAALEVPKGEMGAYIRAIHPTWPYLQT